MFFKSAILAAALFTVPMVASAVTVTTNRDMPTDVGTQLAPTSSSADFRLNFVGQDLSNPKPNSRSPFEEFAGLVDTAFYNSIEGKGFAEYAFGSEQDTFSLIWGSPDSYNTLSFFLGGSLVFSIAGDDAVITGTPGYEDARKFVTVMFDDIAFDTVLFESTLDAFEFAGVVAPVPVPPAAFLLVSALAGIGLLGRRRTEA